MASPELQFCTHRFCNLPSGLDETALRALVPLDQDERILFSSLSPDYDASRLSQTGTITWNTTPSHLVRLAVEDSTTTNITVGSGNLGDGPEVFTTRGNEGTVDSHFRGLTPLNPSPVKDELAVE